MKILGLCGRFMCCLKFEYDNYESVREELLVVGKLVVIFMGEGKVVGINVGNCIVYV